jgi:hypothetical protein
VRTGRRVPVATTPLVRRDADRIKLQEAFRVNRLVDVSGLGGVRKSLPNWQQRLAGMRVTTLSQRHSEFHAGPGRVIRDAIIDPLELEPASRSASLRRCAGDGCRGWRVPWAGFTTARIEHGGATLAVRTSAACHRSRRCQHVLRRSTSQAWRTPR